MAHFIDRRLNPKDKSLGNRRRFLKRVRKHVKRAVDGAIRERTISDIDRGGQVGVPSDGITEPHFQFDPSTGDTEHVLPGNKHFNVGDRIPKPGSSGGSGRQWSDTGSSEDEFLFVLSRAEFLDLFFEDLELPDLIKQALKEIDTHKFRRAGLSTTGNPASLSVRETVRNALGRRIALSRPRNDELHALQARIFELEKITHPTTEQKVALAGLHREAERLNKRLGSIPYIDPLDIRYRALIKHPSPNAHAVMFCLMDVSASMGEREKDLAKRFFVLLHLFLQRRYDRIELIFIRHTQVADEVDEEAFFHSRESGGTIVSSALAKMKQIIEERYPPSEWNIYAAQASDGENYSTDSKICHERLSNELMPLCQYFAYIEITDEAEQEFLSSDKTGGELWNAYLRVAASWPNFAMKRIASRKDIYPVFRELFARSVMGGTNG
ncbi:MAG: YeaH/YhbH family protein [Pseudomonadota bacterium]